MRTQKEIKELIGTKYGYLTIIEEAAFRIKNNYKQRYWNCLCDCGNYKEINHGELMKNNRIKSCGCKTKETTLKKIKEYNDNKYKKLSCTASEYAFYKTYKHSPTVKLRNKEFNISFDNFIKLVRLDCYYCGTNPINKRYSYAKKEFQYLNGLDRVDNFKGYTLDNVVPCCFICNKAKGTMTCIEFKNWVNKIYKFQNKII